MGWLFHCGVCYVSFICGQKIECEIEVFGTLNLVVSGLCVPPQVVKESQSFQCPVRQQDEKGITLINRSNLAWLLKPVIETTAVGDYWTGAEVFEVPQQQQRTYSLTYNPLTMTSDGKKHQGSIMFALPDGTGLYYQLIGQADAPKPMDKIVKEIPCRVQHTEFISVKNWLKTASQRFRVSRDIVKPDKGDPSLKLTGLDFIEVPPGDCKQYKLSLHAFKEGLVLVKLTFTNELTGEYLHGDVQFKIVRGGPQGSVHLVTSVRKSKLHQIQICNPIALQVCFQVNSNLCDLRLPSQVQIPGKSQGCLSIEFMPLKVGRQRGRLEISSQELGLFEYEVDLQATEAATEPVKSFTANIGQSQSQVLRFFNYARTKTEFTCK
ncbi:hypothetical protein Ciccas_008136, partial [Cichlidogyrus casuarinus]